MNKYQEAIDYLNGGNLFGELSNEALGDIEELVDRATPMKQVVLTRTICCSKCNTRLGDNNGWTQATVNFCPTCGQAILWEE